MFVERCERSSFRIHLHFSPPGYCNAYRLDEITNSLCTCDETMEIAAAAAAVDSRHASLS